MLCEGSVLELPTGELVCFMRENSGQGLDAFKCISRDGGETWQGPVAFPLPGCHRPSAGMLQSGRVLITHRFMQGGKGWLGWWTQNLFAALTDVESCLARSRAEAHTRIMPLDFDRSPEADTGYSGWAQFPDGELYAVNYIVDDAPMAHIRGYSFREGDLFLSP
jgi:sialidase-1